MQRYVLKNGYFPSFLLFGVPVFIHWSFPIAGIFLSLFLGDFRLGSIFPLVYSYTLLILIHEFGHAVGAWSAGMKVYKITIDAGGGWCFADEPDYFKERLLLYAGGLLAQLVLFITTVLLVVVLGSPSTAALSLVVFVFTFVNGFAFLVNLIPYGENDGMKIYRLIRER